jgi:hypothetical protein
MLIPTLAAAELQITEKISQGLKPKLFFGFLAARLKSCPFKACRFFASNQ